MEVGAFRCDVHMHPRMAGFIYHLSSRKFILLKANHHVARNHNWHYHCCRFPLCGMETHPDIHTPRKGQMQLRM